MEGQSVSTPHPIAQRLVRLLSSTILLGLASYVYSTLEDGRKEHLTFVRGQIVDLYGPLYTLSKANEEVWRCLGRKHVPDWQNVDRQPTESSVMIWRKMLTTVVQPLNSQIENTLLSSKQTIFCSDVRDDLHQFIVFAESVKLVAATWKDDDLTKSGNMPEGPYPRCMSSRLHRELEKLHVRENEYDNGFWGLFVGPVGWLLEKLGRQSREECASVECPQVAVCPSATPMLLSDTKL